MTRIMATGTDMEMIRITAMEMARVIRIIKKNILIFFLIKAANKQPLLFSEDE
jgi:hypothetical protein